MTLRTLLLGSAAALLTVGGAQAADLGAEPVNYVKVCDAFGAGFYYAPGTDTCMKIGGFTRLDINIKGSEASAALGGNYPNASHTFGMYNVLSVMAASMTEYGPMVGLFVMDNSIGGPVATGTPPVGSGPGNGFVNGGVGVDTRHSRSVRSRPDTGGQTSRITSSRPITTHSSARWAATTRCSSS
jgi:hypothetical protein